VDNFVKKRTVQQKNVHPIFFSLTRPNKPLVYYTKHAHFYHFYDFLYKFYLSLGCFRYLLILLLNILFFFIGGPQLAPS